MSNSLEALPVELVADILGELDIASLITASYLSRRLRAVASESSLNPWRRPILRNLVDDDNEYEPAFKHLSVRQTVPRQNWVEIMTLGKAEYLLFEMTLPNLKEAEWEECFRRRFLPGWAKWKSDGSTWKAAFMKVDKDADRPGRLQNNLAHLMTHARLVVEFKDVRIIVLGVLSKPRSAFSVNQNARLLLHPPGITKGEEEEPVPSEETASTEGSDESFSSPVDLPVPTRNALVKNPKDIYRKMTHPLPSKSHTRYPFYTPSGEDKRWLGTQELEEGGRQWVGPMLVTAQLIGPQTKEPVVDGPPLQDLDLLVGAGRSRYASLTWADLSAIAPWLELTQKITGPGLGH
ncbi:hypothetical protein BN946_scf185015.g87 [Trametes cinnabarina]|uniref:F-box domain-containing protein n=1 Tax=Pycnoporus cinnabarinus TaxID=5643 RepID=A0A060SNG8_PYCCI|nr:hypothetical protein BN946_scf185015.g87 [Trametes cinnabarina]